MDKTEKIFLETRLRNMKRQYAKVVQHADLDEYAMELKSDIDALERELDS